MGGEIINSFDLILCSFLYVPNFLKCALIFIIRKIHCLKITGMVWEIKRKDHIVNRLLILWMI